jgi:signal transduction histidine kinase
MLTRDNTQRINEFQLTLSRFTHEIRNPLTLIDSELQLLASSHPEITQYPDWDIILNNLAYIRELLTDFSSYSNASRLNLSDTPLYEYMNELIQCIRPSMDYLGIRLSAEISEQLPTIPIDRVKLRQAFLNLVQNARDAMSLTDGLLRIRCEELPDKRICLTISDNGQGMTSEQLSRIFTPFVTYKTDGTGLGLPIASEIIAAHGGSLEVESSPGQGSTFRVFLG